jgi:D-serine deaminase-like pyridoxal phosphate-dependent protein
MSGPFLPAIGAGVESIDTPALVIDVDAMERNLAAMAAFAAAHGVRLRPHAKMHKCATIARLQVAAGAVGVCVQKTSEAEALAAAGVEDIYISNEVIDPGKLARVAALAGRVRLAIAVDSPEGVERLAAAVAAASTRIDVFVEVDVGHGRCGVAPAAAGALARRVVAHAPPGGGLRFAGIQAYHGRAQHLRGAGEREATSRHAADLARAAQASIGAAGIACPLVSGGGTGTFGFDVACALWGELQAGSYLFMDRDYADNEGAAGLPRFEHALFVKSQVVSRGVAHAVVDAGHKSHAIDSACRRCGSASSTSRAAATSTASCACGPDQRPPSCRAWATRCGWCPGTAIRPSTCTIATSWCAAAWRGAGSRRCGRSRRAAACRDRRLPRGARSGAQSTPPTADNSAMQASKGGAGHAAEDRLSGPLLEALAQHGNTRPFRAQAILINEGDVSDSIYIVVSGRLRTFASSLDGRDVVLAEHGPGEYVGELALDGAERSASVKAVEPTTCCVVPEARCAPSWPSTRSSPCTCRASCRAWSGASPSR